MGANIVMIAEKAPERVVNRLFVICPRDPAERIAVRNKPMRPIQIMREAIEPARSMSSNVV